jgi:hypothetical protein
MKFGDLWGDPQAAAALIPPRHSTPAIPDTAAEQAELARQIAHALQVRDFHSARLLIAEAGIKFGHRAMAAIEAQAREAQTDEG